MPCPPTRRQRALLLAAALVLAVGMAHLRRGAVSTFVSDAALQSSKIAPPNATDNEPLVDRWQRRFASHSGFLFFKHIRKAGGTALRRALFEALRYHGHATLEQFLHKTKEQEARRHFPFLNERQKRMVAGYYRNQTNTTSVAVADQTMQQHSVYYIEQEFTAMDSRCRDVDPRWNASLRIIALRHPIERHLSEFLYSGPPASAMFDGQQYGKWHDRRNEFVMDRRYPFRIDRTKLYVNQSYTEALAAFLEEHLRAWVPQAKPKLQQSLNWYFWQRYLDNFQLRALAGCASEECLSNDTTKFNADQIIQGRQTIPSSNERTIDSVCTMHPFYGANHTSGDMCHKTLQVCPNSCDGPCFYPAAPWGPLEETHLARAVRALEGFDVVLLTETMDDGDQRALLADALGVPRGKMEPPTEGGSNVRVTKRGDREKTHYYRDLMANLTRPHRAVQSLIEENRPEIALYEHAVRLNRLMTERWKLEVGWENDAHADDERAAV